MIDIRCGDVLDQLAQLKAEGVKVRTCVTSPPYWGLRDYGTAGQIGLEKTPDEYVVKMVEVFRAVREVLADDGTLWLNLGDSFAGGKGQSGTRGAENQESRHDNGASLNRGYQTLGGAKLTKPTDIRSNLGNTMHGIIEGGLIFLAGSGSLTITAKREQVLKGDAIAPNLELTRFLGVKRILFKKRDSDFCQVLNLLDAKRDVWVSTSMSFVAIDDATLEIVLDESDSVRIVVSDNDLQPATPFRVFAPGTLTREYSKVGFTVAEPGEPTAEMVGDVQAAGHPVALDTVSEGLLQVDAIDKAVTLADTFDAPACGLRDFKITKASKQHFALALMNGVVEFTCNAVGHLFVSNSFGSLVRYAEVYDKSKRKSNAMQPKQEIGIPEMVKRALMEDGWICRSTIIWHKPNPMPESVRDRPTKAHEYIFLLSKSPRYFYDADAVREKNATNPNWNEPDSKYITEYHERREGLNPKKGMKGWHHLKAPGTGRNRRSVWTVTTKPYKGAHFATFPPALIEPCILAGSERGDLVLDPFGGSGTTAEVAIKHGRRAILIELNPQYVELQKARMSKVQAQLTLNFAEVKG